MAAISVKSNSPSSTKEPASVIAKRLKAVFATVEYHAIDLRGFKLLRAVVKDTGYRTEVVLKSMIENKKYYTHYEITKENIEDSKACDAIDA